MTLELAEGRELIMDGESWQVERLEPYWGKMMLRAVGRSDGRTRQTTIAALMRHQDCRVSATSLPRLPAAARGRQPATWKDLSKQRQQLLELRLAHLPEVETGFRSGDPFRAGPDEPRPQYDPGLVPLVTDRRLAKVAELAELREREPEHGPVWSRGCGGVDGRMWPAMYCPT
ncbi:hypothetical protein [Nonomuraea jabiensis]|uniref:Uncharacterized protein n=1 Tax=Nonomuraea jabiensis TaxID=882448 RepID=A0A7W9G7T6_9ACTN|nr:hypothetical protein [Nonomuraea jabiensis]MBB5778701.1 hypothetical protein [Nonomuraea jabiensis]